MKTASWILLTLATLLIILGGLGSTFIAYFGAPSADAITPTTTLESLQVSEETATALRGRRGTAGAFAIAFASLLLFVILGPYRKGSLWAWWAILCSTSLLAGFAALRIPALGISQGASTYGILLVVVIIGLLLDVSRLTNRPGAE
jgi:hypothetical protein